MKKSRPVLVVGAIMAGLQILTAGASFTDVVGKDVAGLIILGIAAVQTGMAFYVQSQTVPFEDTAAYINTEGVQVAGPASPPLVIEGQPVRVEASGRQP